MMSDKEVRAEVKLAFTNLNGQSMVCTRTMQLLMKPTGSTFKTLEGQLLLMNRGERTTVSTKCAELDSQVPRFLGVPPAILEYVIFCHQEESLWPLSEPAKLKKKFDEIFQALKFSKAVDNLKVIRKELAVEVKLLEQSVKHFKSDKERADRTKQKLNSSKELIDRYLKEVEMLEEDIRFVSEESEQLFKSNQDFQETLSNLQTLKHSQRSLNDQISRLEDSTRLLPDSDDELQYKHANFETLLLDITKHVEALKEDIHSKQSALKNLREEKNSLVREEGQLQMKQSEYEQNLMVREQTAKRLSEELQIPLVGGDFRKLQSDTQSLFDEEKAKLASTEKKIKAEEALLEKEIRNLSDSKLKEIQHKDYAMADIRHIEKDIKLIQNKINNLDVNEGNIEYEKAALESLEEKLKVFKESKFLDTISSSLKAKNNEISAIENEIEDANKEIAQIHKQSDSHARIGLLKDELKFKENAYTKLKVSNEGLLTQYDLRGDNLSHVLQQKISAVEEEIKETQQQFNKQSSKVSEVESDIRYLEESKLKYTEDLKASQKRYDEVLEGESIDEYDEIVSGADDDYKLTLENLKMLTTTFDFNKKALEHAESKHACYLCERVFPEKTGLNKFIALLKSSTNGEQEIQLKSQLDEAKEYQASVRSIASDVEKIKSIKPLLEEVEKDLISKKQKLKEEKTSLGLITERLSDLKEASASLNSLRNPTGELERLGKEVGSLKLQIQEKSDELADYGYSSKTLAELQEFLDEKNTLLKTVRKSITALFEDRDNKQRELTLLEGSLKDKRLAISNMQKSLMERDNLLKSIDDYKVKMSTLEGVIKKSDEVVQELEAELTRLTEKLEVLHSENEKKLDEENHNLSKTKSMLDELVSLNRKIDDYIENYSKNLKSCQSKIESINEETSELEREVEKLLQVVSEEEKKLGNANEEFRNYRNNIDLRHLYSELKDLENEISSINVEEAEAARDKYQERSGELREEYSKLNALLAGKMGEIKQIEDQIRQTEKELNTEFKDVYEGYREELAKYRFKSVALSDADTYSKAIDTAIMNFHSLKMKEANRIIDDLWKGTYSGTDVDTIKIRSDPVTAGKGNKSYNYRVVMVKNEVELDMRGRCSAGQKVLASIIIRLALAECFGTNCGVIALDEPTTNLDADNIESLARSLSNIIELRKSQKNFQLIVITHDEKFLNAMNASKYTDHFYRIRRNQAQKSEIDWVKINRISE